jgi:hypothetical protein
MIDMAEPSRIARVSWRLLAWPQAANTRLTRQRCEAASVNHIRESWMSARIEFQ